MFCLTASLEDYLEIIYILQQGDSGVGITDISRELKISKPSVTKAIGILRSEELVIQEKYGKITLTEKGVLAAEEVYKKHKILSKFINKVLGVNERTAEIDACKMEHVLSAETLLGMKKYLNKIN
ncbi:MAG: metal-dependent transcriptional regulator [Clostridia bacterium]|nr:metal-dependent transcriptional regulator [Clostridia bacterium]